ncbi:MDR family MFS transporter [Bacillus sp. 1A]|uniref:MDR family MFS transporter n=1 Tax=Bacillus sp. 1A TaxID=3461399 RepID=UPI0040451571
MEQKTKKTPYFMITIMMIGSFVAILNNVLLNNALPMIMKDLHVEQYSTVQWLTTAYMLIAGVLIPTSAYFITKFKSNHVFIAAMSIFSVGTILAIFANTFPFLLTARIIQAIGATVLSPLLMNVMLVSFTKAERGKALGIYTLIVMFAPSIGPTISGIIVDSFGWRMLFIAIAPFAIISLGLAIWKLENVLEQRDTKIDAISVALSTISFSSILYGFSSAGTKGWGDITVYGLIIFGFVILAIFTIRQFKIENPLLDLRVFKYSMFSLSSVLCIILSMIMYSGMILLPYFLQTVQGHSVLISGLVLLPGALLTALFMPYIGRLYDRFSALPLVLIGFPVVGISTYFLSILEFDTSTYYVATWFAVRSIGTALVMMPIQTNALNQLPRRLNPSGTAVYSTIQQVAGAIGTAVLVTLMTTHAADRTRELSTTMNAAMASKQGLLDAINYTSLVTIGLAVIATILSLFIRKRISED